MKQKWPRQLEVNCFVDIALHHAQDGARSRIAVLTIMLTTLKATGSYTLSGSQRYDS
jgi:hypothetical protein